MIHQGQLDGLRRHHRIQLGRRAAEDSDISISTFYGQLLAALKESLVGRSMPRFLRSNENPDSVVAVALEGENCVDVAVVNLSAELVRAQFNWAYGKRLARILFGTAPDLVPSISLSDTLFCVDLCPFAAHLLRFD
jgi:hypothetical protein